MAITAAANVASQVVDVTVMSGGGGTGTVTSIDVSGGTTGLTFSGGPITVSGLITMAGTLGVANGGTGSTTTFTTGSIVFAGASGVYSQDNANFFWDATNHRLGLGTTGPGTFLHISNATGNQLSRWSGYGLNPGYVQFDNTGGVLTMGLESSVGGGLMTGGLAYAGVLQSVGAKALQFGTSNAARLTIDSTGNVGIGTTGPLSLLDVNGVATIGHVARNDSEYLTVKTDPTTGDTINFGSSRSWGFVQGGTRAPANGFGIRDYLSGSTRLNIDASGNVNIGANAAGGASRLEIHGDGTTGQTVGIIGADRGWFLTQGGTQGSAGSFAIRDGFANANRILIDGSGNVGVGTNSPTSPLTVNGTIEIKSGSGGVLKFADGTSQASAAAGGGTVTGTGVATNVAFWTAGSTISSDNAFFWDNTNKRLGLGTTTPDTRLTLASGDSIHFLGGSPNIYNIPAVAAATNLTFQSSASGAIGFPGVNGAAMRLSDDGAGNGTIAFATTTAERARISSTGAFGINTNAPGAKLDIKDDTATCLRLSGSTSGFVGLRPAAAAGSTTYTLPTADSTGTQYLSSNGAGVLSWSTPAGAGTVTSSGPPSAGMIAYYTTATNITGSGNVFWSTVNNRLGLLTSSPIATLHVGAQTNAPVLTSQVLVDVAAPAYITAKDTADSTEIAVGADASGGYVGTPGNSVLNLVQNGSVRASLAATTGYLGVGMTASRLLDVSNTGVARMKVQDYGGQVFNIMAYGAVGDGTTDDTAAINSAITAASAVTNGNGVVYIPGGYKFKTTGNHSIAHSGLSVLGDGAGSSVFALEHATNDLFVINAAAGYDDLTIGQFSVSSATVRTAGWTVKYAPAWNAGVGIRRFRIFDITMTAQFNGIWIASGEFGWLTSCLMDYPSTTGTTGGIGFKMGQTAGGNVAQVSEVYLQGCQAYVRAQTSLSYGIWIEDSDAVYLITCGSSAYLNSITVTNSGHGCSNHFWTQVVADATSSTTSNNHSCWIKGTNPNINFQISNCWFASAGKLGGGVGTPDAFHADSKLQLSTITGSLFYNSTHYGLYTKDFQGCVAGNTMWGNTTMGLYVDATGVGNPLAHYTGNYSLDSWITSATAARCGFIGNFYGGAAPTYGVAPGANFNNVTY